VNALDRFTLFVARESACHESRFSSTGDRGCVLLLISASWLSAEPQDHQDKNKRDGTLSRKDA